MKKILKTGWGVCVLSLFDGISCGHVALERAGIKVDKYYASEIDKYAISITQHNYPDTIQLGDVNNVDFSQFIGKIDILMGGSPCQDLSIAHNNRKGLDGERSGLFFKYVEALRTIKPKYFLLENVASMSKADRDKITEIMGVEPIMINSALVSAQQRKRLYWTNIPNIQQPKDRNILLKDIIESDVEDSTNLSDKYGLKDYSDINDKAKTLTASMYKGYGNDGVMLIAIPCALRTREDETGKYKRLEIKKDGKANSLTSVSTDSMYLKPIRLGYYGKGGQGQRIYSVYGKSVCLGLDGSINEKHKIDLPDGDYIIRKLTPLECERLQTLNDNYTAMGYDSDKEKEVKISNTQRYKCIGNGWTVDVIAHIFKNIE